MKKKVPQASPRNRLRGFGVIAFFLVLGLADGRPERGAAFAVETGSNADDPALLDTLAELRTITGGDIVLCAQTAGARLLRRTALQRPVFRRPWLQRPAVQHAIVSPPPTPSPWKDVPCAHCLIGPGRFAVWSNPELTSLKPTFVSIAAAQVDPPPHPAIEPVTGMPPVLDPKSVYSVTHAGAVSPDAALDLERIYVPTVAADWVDVIDPKTMKIVDRLRTGLNPQHVVVGWNMRTLWVAADAERTMRGSVMPIDPRTGKAGAQIPVDDPYNMYFTPDGKSAIIVAEARQRLDFRDPNTMAMQSSLSVSGCAGVNHADFSIDGRYAIFTCEFNGSLAKIDMVNHKVTGMLRLSRGGMPQDVRMSPDGRVFYVADMHADGVFLIDGASFTEIGFIPTGVGTHGLYPSRDGKKLYVSNRGTHSIRGMHRGPGSVSVIDFASRRVETTWPIPGGGSPDMGNVTADGKFLWLSGRYDNVVYRFDTATGAVATVAVDMEPHGLAVWPQPGRYSLGHTGVMR